MRRFLSIAICGIPNAGKSSLVNALMEQNVVGVSSKVQTTRSNVRCVITEGDKQLVFVDTPGVFIPKRFLEKKLVRNANNGMESADLACLVIDAQRGLDKTSLDLLNRFAKDCKEAIAVINKVDIAREADILCLGKQLFETGLIKEQFFISATKGRGISELKQYFFDNVRERCWRFDADEIADRDTNFIISDLTRATLFGLLNKELPYGVNVVTENIFNNDGTLEVYQTIVTNEQKHKAIIIGKGGKVLKKLIARVSPDIEKILDAKITLKLFVKVKENWVEHWDEE